MAKMYDREKLELELNKANYYIEQFGLDFLEGVSFNKVVEEFPELMKVIKSYLRFLDVKVTMSDLKELWDNHEALNFEDDIPIIMKSAEAIVLGKSHHFSMFVY